MSYSQKCAFICRLQTPLIHVIFTWSRPLCSACPASICCVTVPRRKNCEGMEVVCLRRTGTNRFLILADDHYYIAFKIKHKKKTL